MTVGDQPVRLTVKEYELLRVLSVNAGRVLIYEYALGAYLARIYGGAVLFSDILQRASSGIDAIEAALAAGRPRRLVRGGASRLGCCDPAVG